VHLFLQPVFQSSTSRRVSVQPYHGIIGQQLNTSPIPVAARSKASVCGRSLTGSWVRIPPGGGHGCLSVVSIVCCQAEVSATSWSLVQRSPTECGVSIRVIVKRRKVTRPRPPKGCRAIEKEIKYVTPTMLFSVSYEVRVLSLQVSARTPRYTKSQFGL
jgi:hypothetical protein